MIRYSMLLLVLPLLVMGSLTLNYKKVIHNTDPQAKCLDGSPGLLYVHEGGDNRNILIYFQGEGVCADETMAKSVDSCYERSKTLLGSSKNWPQELGVEQTQGYLSTDPRVNAFSSWLKIIFPYCDGNLHQGYAKSPIKYKDASLYFRGGAIIRSHLDWIQSRYDLKGADKIVFTGGSAGGIAVNIWSNYLKDIVGNEKVYPIADAGAYMNYKAHNGDARIQKIYESVYKLANIDQSTPLTQCNTAHKGEEWKCFFLQTSYPFIKGRFLVMNAEYDSLAISNILGYNCLKKAQSGSGDTLTNCTKAEVTYIEKYRSVYRDVLNKFLTANTESSVWSIACANHVFASVGLLYDSPFQKIPALVGKTVRAAVQQFVFDGKRVLSFDMEGWPSNVGCAK